MLLTRQDKDSISMGKSLCLCAATLLIISVLVSISWLDET